MLRMYCNNRLYAAYCRQSWWCFDAGKASAPRTLPPHLSSFVGCQRILLGATDSLHPENALLSIHVFSCDHCLSPDYYCHFDNRSHPPSSLYKLCEASHQRCVRCISTLRDLRTCPLYLCELRFAEGSQACFKATVHRFHIFLPFADNSPTGYKEQQIASAFADCLVITEMFFLSVAHFFIYPCGENATFRDCLDRSVTNTTAPHLCLETEAVIAVDDSVRIPFCRCSCRSVRKVLIRVYRVFNLLDIYTFRNDLHCHLRSNSMDLLRRPSCACCRFLCCEFLPGPRSMDGQIDTSASLTASISLQING